jgi:hypothetical protein
MTCELKYRGAANSSRTFFIGFTLARNGGGGTAEYRTRNIEYRREEERNDPQITQISQMGKLCKRWMFITGKTGRGRGGDRIISGRIICGMILS